uniref:Uncharacterized protein LOC105117470 isoform X2 n=1 Tax=Rhizophora mucronata TaxID=61149 RepID=A0A2P2ILT4_RHIMU
MTLKHRRNIQNIAQKEKVSIFKEKNGTLGGAQVPGLIGMSGLQQKLDLSEDDQQSDKEKVNDEDRITCGGNQRLLMLAHSAELMLESEDSSNRGYGNSGTSEEQHQDWIENVSDAAAADPRCVEKKIDGMTAIDQVMSERVGCHWKGRTPRLTQIKCLARLKDELSAQQKIGEFEIEHLGGRRVRLTQIRCLARLKSQLVQEASQLRTEKCSHGNSQGRTVRLSTMKHRARSKNGLLVQEAIEDSTHMCLDSQTSQDNQTQKIIAEIFGEEESFQEVDPRQL